MTTGHDLPTTAADRYWRACCAVAAALSFGWSWPPTGRSRHQRAVGHWGCNPGIAWAVGQLVAAPAMIDDDFLLVVGTGHAGGFVLAHEALATPLSPQQIQMLTRRHGRPGGDPTEPLGVPGLPFFGGELGPALAVSQGIAAARGDRLVVTIVGDGECETPAALAAFAHRAELLDGTPGRWLPVVNANGARMGGACRFDYRTLADLLTAMGYLVVHSTADAGAAASAASDALQAAAEGRTVVWISQTEKGWPLPATIGPQAFRGSDAHTARSLRADDPAVAEVLKRWLADMTADGVFDDGGAPAADVTAIARRASLQLDGHYDRPESLEPRRRPKGTGLVGRIPGWDRPVGSCDAVLARRGTLVFSPDEASSNRLDRCLDAGIVREVLAEEVCAAWTWGTVEAGREAVFATYEAFSPLAASQLAQYAKLVHSRPRAGRPPLTVLLTSLGWANSPTHQNSDLVGTVLSRSWPRMRLVCPVGATSAGRRLDQLVTSMTDGVVVVVASKQPLLDLPDPGTPLVGLRQSGVSAAAGVIVAVGDVSITEAVAAMTLANEVGVSIRVVAVVEPSALRTGRMPASSTRTPTIGSAWCAATFIAPSLWMAYGGLFGVAGYDERWGATPWETLCRNGMDRVSLLSMLADSGCPLPASFLSQLRKRLPPDMDAGEGVPRFDAPALTAHGIELVESCPSAPRVFSDRRPPQELGEVTNAVG